MRAELNGISGGNGQLVKLMGLRLVGHCGAWYGRTSGFLAQEAYQKQWLAYGRSQTRGRLFRRLPYALACG